MIVRSFIIVIAVQDKGCWQPPVLRWWKICFFAFLKFNTSSWTAFLACGSKSHLSVQVCQSVPPHRQNKHRYSMKLHKALRDCFLIAVVSKAGWSLVIISETQKKQYFKWIWATGELQLIAHEKYIIKATHFGVGVCRDCSMSVCCTLNRLKQKNYKIILIKQNN